jgi:hypothetical protein
MIGSRTVGVGILGLILSTHAVHGQGGSLYREFQSGGDMASVAASTGMSASEAKTVHQRPALLQDLQWRRPFTLSGPAAAPVDPVQQIAFSFYNDQLFRLVIDYDHDQTEGLTDADMIEAISTMYGSTVNLTPKTSRATASRIDEESGTRVARWGNAEYSAVLYRSSYASGFRMIVTSVRLDALARLAEARALRLDEREAPQREIARQKKEADDARALHLKARVANKAAFKP